MLNRFDRRTNQGFLRGLFSAVLSTALCLSLLCGAAVHAKERSSGQTSISIEQAIASVKSVTSGKVLKVKPFESHYRVKVLTPDGHVKHFKVDRASGAVIQ